MKSMKLQKTEIHLKQISNQHGTQDQEIKKTWSDLEFNNFQLIV